MNLLDVETQTRFRVAISGCKDKYEWAKIKVAFDYFYETTKCNFL